MCFELEELNLKVVMTVLETRVGTVLWIGEELWDGGVVKLVWIKGVCNCVELLAPCDRLFQKLHRLFGDTEGGRGMRGEDLSYLNCTHL